MPQLEDNTKTQREGPQPQMYQVGTVKKAALPPLCKASIYLMPCLEPFHWVDLQEESKLGNLHINRIVGRRNSSFRDSW